VYSYTIKSFQSSGRCIFLDPLELLCFIYPVRPNTCRLYPVSFDIDNKGKKKVVLDSKKCPGIGLGIDINISEILKIEQKSLKEFIKDKHIFEKYLEEKFPINNSFIKNQKKIFIMKNTISNKNIIEPLVDLGLIPYSKKYF
jgi:hypothetical protein